MYKSRCCNEELELAGNSDFYDKQICTQYYVCSKCNLPSDPRQINKNDS